MFVEVSADARRPLVRSELYIDGQFLAIDTSAPFSFSTTLPNTIKRGFHTIKVVSYDDVDNAGSDTVGVTIAQDGSDASFDLIDPKNGQTIERSEATFTVVAQLKNPQEYSSATIFAQPLNGGVREMVGQVVNPSSPFMTFEWTLPESGSWVLSAAARPKNATADVTTTGVLVRIIAGQKTNTPAEPTVEGAQPTEPSTDIFVPESELKLF